MWSSDSYTLHLDGDRDPQQLARDLWMGLAISFWKYGETHSINIDDIPARLKRASSDAEMFDDAPLSRRDWEQLEEFMGMGPVYDGCGNLVVRGV